MKKFLFLLFFAVLTGVLFGQTDVKKNYTKPWFQANVRVVDTLGIDNLIKIENTTLEDDGAGTFVLLNNSGASSSLVFQNQNTTTVAGFSLGLSQAIFDQTGLLDAGKINLNFGVTNPSLILESDAASGGFHNEIVSTTPTADRTTTLQDGSGTVAFLSDIPAAPTTIYSGDASIAADRILTQAFFDLTFAGGGASGKTVFAFPGNSGNIHLFDDTGTKTVSLDAGATTHSWFKNSLSIGQVTGVAARLDILGSGSTSASTSLLINNSAGTDVLKITDDESVVVGTFSGSNDNQTILMVNGNSTSTPTGAIAFHAKANLNAGTTSDVAFLEHTDISGGNPSLTNSILRVMGGWAVSGAEFALKASPHPYLSMGDDVINKVMLYVNHVARHHTSLASTSIGLKLANLASFATTTGNTFKKGMEITSTGAFTNSSGGGAKNIGLDVTISGGDLNYAALFNGGQIGVGNTAPDPSALSDMTSTTQGSLIPRMTETQRDAIVSPATALEIYSTTSNEFNYFDGTSWVSTSTNTGIESFFLDAQGSFGTGGGWADQVFIDNLPALAFDDLANERAVYMFYAVERAIFSNVDPIVAFIIYTSTAPGVGTEDVEFVLTAKYIADGEQTSKAADETLTQTFTCNNLAEKTRQISLSFVLDRTLITDQDVVFLQLNRLGGDGNDTYTGDIAVSQSGIIVETRNHN